MGEAVQFPKTFFVEESFMKSLSNKKLVTRIGIITSAITLVGMLLWVIVSANTAAVSSELSSQARTLSGLISRFQIS